MTRKSRWQRAGLWSAGGLGLTAAGYAAIVGWTWVRYGHPAGPGPDEADPLLDRFMPDYEVVERHHVRVHAPAAITLVAAAETDLQQPSLVKAIFRARELTFGSTPDDGSRPKGLLAETQSLGWRILAEVPGREIVVGSVTQPWLANVVFRGLPPGDFAGFRDPGYVKIVWTLRADPVTASESIFRTETRVVTTDAKARARFRWYWSRVSSGIILIRRGLLGVLKSEAERRALEAPPVRRAS